LLADYRKPRTPIVRSENRGLPAAKNLGIAHTTGPYFCALDADDRADPKLLERSVAALDADPSLAFVSHWLRTFGEETKDWTPTSCDLPALLDTNTVNGAALVRRSAVVAAGGGFDESMRDGCEDWDLWITLVERGFPGRILPEVLYYYRRRADSMSKLMVQGDGHVRLYRFLVQKHAASYREHVGALLVRREADTCALRRHVHDLELEYHRWMAPEIAKQRDDAVVRERKIGRDRTHLEAALEVARTRAFELDAALTHARSESDALRASMSWRITAPLRAVYERLLSRRRSRHQP